MNSRISGRLPCPCCEGVSDSGVMAVMGVMGVMAVMGLMGVMEVMGLMGVTGGELMGVMEVMGLMGVTGGDGADKGDGGNSGDGSDGGDNGHEGDGADDGEGGDGGGGSGVPAVEELWRPVIPWVPTCSEVHLLFCFSGQSRSWHKSPCARTWWGHHCFLDF